MSIDSLQDAMAMQILLDQLANLREFRVGEHPTYRGKFRDSPVQTKHLKWWAGLYEWNEANLRLIDAVPIPAKLKHKRRSVHYRSTGRASDIPYFCCWKGEVVMLTTAKIMEHFYGPRWRMRFRKCRMNYGD